MGTFRKSAGAVLCAAAILAAGSVGAEEKGGDKAAEKPKVAVRNFQAKGVDPSIAATLETSFCSALGEKMDAICPDELKAIMASKQIQLGVGGCDNEEECLKEISSVANANRIVTGEVSKLGEAYIVSVALIEASSNKVLARASEKTGKLEDLLDKVNVLADKLSKAK